MEEFKNHLERKQKLPDSLPFNRFDLREALRKEKGAEDIWSQIRDLGVYLSSTGTCFVSKEDSWLQFESFKSFADYRDQSKSQPENSDLPTQDVKKQLKQDITKMREQLSSEVDSGNDTEKIDTAIKTGDKVKLYLNNSPRWSEFRRVTATRNIEGRKHVKVSANDDDDLEAFIPANKFKVKKDRDPETFSPETALSKTQIQDIIQATVSDDELVDQVDDKDELASTAAQKILKTGSFFLRDEEGTKLYAVRAGDYWQVYNADTNTFGSEKTAEDMKDHVKQGVVTSAVWQKEYGENTDNTKKEKSPKRQEQISRQKDYLTTAQEIIGNILNTYPSDDELEALDESGDPELQQAVKQKKKKKEAIQTTLKRIENQLEETNAGETLDPEDESELQKTIRWIRKIVKNHELDNDAEKKAANLKDAQKTLQASTA
ncbi:MAG: hypothetical protein BRC25_02920 [Parcubacteria group bacterium SW_6_46_9]|nr:MAG: hypothetical protein BRC25_02920 [Parcubacteria group bacterium SW_6_46_9]